jgi:predicted metalloprotease with PDZ domain
MKACSVNQKSFLFLSILIVVFNLSLEAQTRISFLISVLKPETQKVQVEIKLEGFQEDTLVLKMPQWMPGYYQIMNYAENVEELRCTAAGKDVQVIHPKTNTWLIAKNNVSEVVIRYNVKATRAFVANCFVDTTRAYLVTAGCLLYPEKYIIHPVSVKIEQYPQWKSIATGLEPIENNTDLFSAPNFDVLYDCPILIGNLESLGDFPVRDVPHCFTGFQLGTFDRELFTNRLQKVVQAAVSIFDDVPYKQYTFIGTGPGRGGIEHLNNTTISFNGDNMKTDEEMIPVLSFIGHEYFHHFNVKRIRPFELGPFDYDRENRTFQLWVSEGISVYYQNVLLRRAGLTSKDWLLDIFESEINSLENNPGRKHQSLAQSSYNTWEDGPFSNREKGKAISYYEKGPVVGMIFDLAIRNATQNKKSLDDVMRYVYELYYKKLQRGFTDAEFRQACEKIAETQLSEEFDYVYTTREIDYEKYLGFAGIKIEKSTKDDGKTFINLSRIENPDPLQKAVQHSWLAENELKTENR